MITTDMITTERIRLAFIRPKRAKDVGEMPSPDKGPGAICEYWNRQKREQWRAAAEPKVRALALMSELAKSTRLLKASVNCWWAFSGVNPNSETASWYVTDSAELECAGLGNGRTWFIGRGARLLSGCLTSEQLEKAEDDVKKDYVADVARNLRCAVECSAFIDGEWSEPAWWMPDGKRVEAKDFSDAIADNVDAAMLRRAAEGLD